MSKLEQEIRKIDEALEYLKVEFDAGVSTDDSIISVWRAWHYPTGGSGGRLFAYCSPLVVDKNVNGRYSGCLTQIRLDMKCCALDKYGDVDEALTLEIRNDERIPKDISDITKPSDLDVFAEWQKRLAELYYGEPAAAPGGAK